MKILLFSFTEAPFHLLGLKGHIGVRANNEEFKGNIDPCG